MTSTEDRQPIEKCPKCGVALPLCQAGPDEPAVCWTCVHCQQTTEGVLDPAYHVEDLRNVHPPRVQIVQENLEPIGPDVLAYARDRIVESLHGVEKRSATRHRAILQIPAQPLDKMLVPVGKPFLVTTCNISTKGIGLLHVRPVTEPFLAVEMTNQTGTSLQLLVRLLRRRPKGPYFDVAGDFLTKMAASGSELTTAE